MVAQISPKTSNFVPGESPVTPCRAVPQPYTGVSQGLQFFNVDFPISDPQLFPKLISCSQLQSPTQTLPRSELAALAVTGVRK